MASASCLSLRMDLNRSHRPLGREEIKGTASVSLSRTGRWKSPEAVVTPMQTHEVKNRTLVEDIKSLRLITAIKTPYLPDGRFDLNAYDSMVRMQIDNSVEGVIVGDVAGEGHLMSWDEHIMLIGHTVNCFGEEIKVIGNAGSDSTSEAIRATEQGFNVGMHAALHGNPYFGKTSMKGVVSHLETIHSMGPTIICNSRTGQDIPPPLMHKILQYPNMAGVKECMGNKRIKDCTDNGMVIWSGNDGQCHDARWEYGARGVISVASNLIPCLMHALMFRGCDPLLNSNLMPLFKWLSCEPIPDCLNTALAQLRVVQPIFKLPCFPLPLKRRLEFVGIVEDIGRENFVGEKDVQALEDGDFIFCK